MHPAKSVIYFTTATGAGYGLFVFAFVFTAYFEAEIRWGLGVAFFGVSFFLIITGLLASMLHLGHPGRAWRAFSQWRSSWLSREGIFSVAFFLPAVIYAWGWLALGDTAGIYYLAGALASGLALLTVFSTGKIYSTLKPIPAWAHPLTVPGYLLLSLVTGGILFLPISQLWFLHALPTARFIVVILLFLGMGLKLFYWRAIREDPATETAAGATGLKGKVNLFEGPHDQKNYLMKEMGFEVARKHADKLRGFATGFLFLMPLTTIVLSGYAPSPDASFGLLTVAVFFMVPGVMIERWLFFAEAKHVQTLYYGADEV